MSVKMTVQKLWAFKCQKNQIFKFSVKTIKVKYNLTGTIETSLKN